MPKYAFSSAPPLSLQAVANILVNQMTEEDVKKLANLFSTLGACTLLKYACVCVCVHVRVLLLSSILCIYSLSVAPALALALANFCRALSNDHRH